MITVCIIIFFIKIMLVADILPHFLFPPAIVSESYSVRGLHERLAHGRQLKIYLPKNAEKLEFSPADQLGRIFTLWERGHVRSETGWSWREAGCCFQFCCSWCIFMYLLFYLLQGDQRQGVWHRQWPTLVHRQGNQSHLFRVCPTGNAMNCLNKAAQFQLFHLCVLQTVSVMLVSPHLLTV